MIGSSRPLSRGDRANFNVMIRYVSHEANLKLVMNLLRGKPPSIRFEAFHIFKVFVANPKETPPIENILRRSKQRLLTFLKDFHDDKGGACSLKLG
ncbi:hypothetical protein FRB99_000410 [Tulasnella sp. 403]|nr:hypothetical protein FRB99_000410 [Tulasnella sp. 403]